MTKTAMSVVRLIGAILLFPSFLMACNQEGIVREFELSLRSDLEDYGVSFTISPNKRMLNEGVNFYGRRVVMSDGEYFGLFYFIGSRDNVVAEFMLDFSSDREGLTGFFLKSEYEVTLVELPNGKDLKDSAGRRVTVDELPVILKGDIIYNLENAVR